MTAIGPNASSSSYCRYDGGDGRFYIEPYEVNWGGRKSNTTVVRLKETK
jgi:hypothetical protein